ncbi:Zn-ribbon domain-containing OB-fold protein [Yinghuangia sp. YIM S09857]|uniref:Zn-ribbon domain-containing OB-fold protein n=1 Tax=Yinghuangia sp. YIM S09857 TaxID=3436929 RepID=UPI003F53365D
MTTSPARRPVPRPTKLSEPFWRACAEGRLLHQRCSDCGAAVFKPQAFCPRCLSNSIEWKESSGRGVVNTFSVVWRPQTPAFQVPYVVAVIELEEGYQMMSNIVNCDVDAVHCDMPVSVVFEPVDADEDVVLPFFEPRR